MYKISLFANFIEFPLDFRVYLLKKGIDWVNMIGLALKNIFASLTSSIPYLLIINYSLLIINYGKAQEYAVPYQILGDEEGMTARIVQDILEDSRGFIWIGTGEGLFRYDGKTFKSYSTV